ncbi:MAG: TIGR04282 family arsenosugar biosynthesis glycosyltransferase [Ghiorsea sp.]|nr:TIGR04282 family arsenosugar biosynthesis glycosyltransferase [Ghiorsea sp.]
MRVIILSKAPVAGQVKTRLMPQYSAQEAADLQQEMTATVLKKVCSLFDDVWLVVDDTKHPFFASLQADFTFDLQHQGDGNLGNRLERLLHRSFSVDDEPVMFLGSDSPHIHITRYQQVISALQHHDIVLGAVEDGGYDLLATSVCEPLLFQGISWGSSSVLEETVVKAHHLKLSMQVLELSFDLDRAEDLRRAPPCQWDMV